MKRNALWLLAVFILIGGCASPAGQAMEADKTAQPVMVEVEVHPTQQPEPAAAFETPEQKEALAEQDLSGCYENDSYDTAILSRIDEEYYLAASLYRVTVIDRAIGTADGERIVFQASDEMRNPLTLSFFRDGETFTLRVEESTWEPLPVGTEIKGLVKTADEPLTDWERVASEPAEQRGHYVFSPKICSVYMEELFGKDMCDAWFCLIDAVLAGEDTFACKDQHTYDWVIGQFPERCLPILRELIDYAYERDHAVRDGVASFTYLVPPEEAKARIEQFGAEIEDIVNAAVMDDDTDFEKAFALYGYVMEHYEYDYELAERMEHEYVDGTGILRLSRTGKGVCHELSMLYSYLLQQTGVQATIMMGADHQWSYARINGHDYHIDPTFGLTDRESLAYFLMTDEQREETGFAKKDFVITSNYAQDHPHPDYRADDDHFRPLWSAYYGELLRDVHIAYCPIGEDENGEWRFLEFDYTGY